ncbi:MAG: elongation factor G [Actinobacteria bacterium]|nr:MAG: elongation factor G [Actinomycetota bacterium]
MEQLGQHAVDRTALAVVRPVPPEQQERCPGSREDPCPRELVDDDEPAGAGREPGARQEGGPRERRPRRLSLEAHHRNGRERSNSIGCRNPRPGPRTSGQLSEGAALKTYDAKDIRNVLLIGHGGAGKTTLLEALLFASGAITRMGTVEDGNTVSDHDPDEQRRGISVSLAMAPIEWKGVKINALDAPGTADFVGDLRNAIRAVDAVIVVVSAVDGVEVQTEYAWELAVDEGLPRAIFVNKLDRERADFQSTLDQLVSSFGTQVAPFELPIGQEHEFGGIADLLHEKADLYPSGPMAEESEWPDDIHAMADPAREKLMEAVAESDDALIEEYLEQGTLPEEHIVNGAKAGFAAARLAPVLVGSASRAIGIDRLLDFIVEEFPSPLDRGPITVIGKGGETKERPCDPAGPTTAFVFKTVSDPFVGHVTMFRVFSGRVRPDSSISNATQNAEERLGQLFTQKGKEHESIAEVPAGDIGAVAKLQASHTGDTWSTKDDPVQLQPVELPEPLLAYAITPATKGDEDKLATGLARLREEDPSFHVARNEETHEMVIYGMGEAHLDVQMSRLKAKFGVDVHHTPAKIAFRETVRGKAAAQGRHVKQTGGHGQYAICNIELEPLPRGEGFVYEDKITGGAIPQQFIPSIEKGVVKTMAEGVISGNPMVDIKVTLVDGKFHTVDSSDMAFQIAGSLALKEAVEKAGVVLLEPIVQLSVVVPESFTGDIMGDLNAKRGKIQGMEQIGGGKQRINALVPQAEVARYVIDLRSMTGGRGAFAMTFSHYEEMPSHLASKVIEEYQRSREEAHKR